MMICVSGPSLVMPKRFSKSGLRLDCLLAPPNLSISHPYRLLRDFVSPSAFHHDVDSSVGNGHSVAFVFALMIEGIIEASKTRKPSAPFTRRS